MHATMAELFLDRANDESTGLLFEDQQWSWRELITEAGRRAGVLTDVRPPAGTPWHIGVLMKNCPEYLFLVAGAALCGATIVGINSTRRGAELARDIDATDCAVVITDSAHRELLDGFEDQVGRLLEVEGPEYQSLLDAHADDVPTASPEGLDPKTTLLLMFTSGSTGSPKAVICSTERWARVTQSNPIEFNSDDVAYNAMPLFHGNALMSAWSPCINSGAALALRDKFSASGFLPDVRRFGATFFNYVGRSLSYVLAQPERPEESDNRLRFGFGTEASEQDRTEFTRRFGAPLFESYGSSEGTLYISRTPDTPAAALGRGQVGFDPVILDADGNECPPAEFDDNGTFVNANEAIGEIVSLGAATIFEGYYRNPEATAERLRGGQDYWTGDLGYRDAEGFFYYAGRTNDWIRVDSENFGAAPIERILLRHPDIANAVVYAVPDPRTGDRVMVTLELGHGDTRFDADGFTRFLAEQSDMGTKWAPYFIRVTPAVPLTATNKVDKPRLKRERWHTDDPMWIRTDDGSYRQLSVDEAQLIAEEFTTHGRRHLIA